MGWKHAAGILGVVCVFQAGLIVGGAGAASLDARAEEPIAPFYDPPRLLCRPFAVAVEGAGATLETNDLTTEVGKWVAQHEERYELFSLDFEVGQKPTGYPTAWTWACLSPRR